MGEVLQLVDYGGCVVLRAAPDYGPSEEDQALVASAPDLAAQLAEAVGLLGDWMEDQEMKETRVLGTAQQRTSAFMARVDAKGG